MPGTQPGMADHAPTGWVVAGAGPGAEHRFFATFGASRFLRQRASYMTL